MLGEAMLSEAISGQPATDLTIRLPQRGASLTFPRPRSVWQRWRSLHDDIVRHVRACDRLGVELTVEQLADELDEALGLVERRVEELHSLRLITRHRDGRVEPDAGDQRLCG